MSGAMPPENVQRQLVQDVYQEEFLYVCICMYMYVYVYVLFLRTRGLDYEAFAVIRTSETDVVNFLVFHVSFVLGNTLR